MLLKTLKKLTHNSILRLVATYLSVFVLSSFILVAFIYWSSIDYIYKQLDHHISYDYENLSYIYQHEGSEKLIQSINERLKQNNYDSIYLLYDPNKKLKLAGNLHLTTASIIDGWSIVSLDKLSTSKHQMAHSARIFKNTLNANLVLINGLDIESAHRQEQTIINNIIYGVIIVFILGVIGGFIISINTIKKINLINSAMLQVGDGNIKQRVAIDGSDDDFDLLAKNFNQMLERIQVLMESLQNISNNIAHDLRTPLTRIRNRLETLYEQCEGSQNNTNQSDEIELAIEETDNLLATFETILNINKFQSGVQKLNRQKISSKKLLTDIIEYNEPLAFDKSINIIFEPANDIDFTGDQNMLFLALTNIINNAIKYTPENGKITISYQLKNSTIAGLDLKLSENNSYLEMIIADNGSGIPEQERDKVFELFYRSEACRSESGNGLGLSLVLSIIDLHQGIIELNDNQPGLAVCLYLPT
ncbi:MAG: HAMP domain-containing histidine kinase [Gammaproteobacteria bacterium]|nr:HAMP domain-containing histidine kinase [Gammaproteobacteria bacterium]